MNEHMKERNVKGRICQNYSDKYIKVLNMKESEKGKREILWDRMKWMIQ